jgi:hypothetical protein
MNKKIVAIGVVAALGLFILLLNIVFNQGSKREGSSCKQFIVAIQQNDPEYSYGLLAQDIRDDQPYDEWEKQVKDLSILYSAQEPQLKSSNTTKRDANNEPVATREVYTFSTGSLTYTYTCFIDNTQTITGYHIEQTN